MLKVPNNKAKTLRMEHVKGRKFWRKEKKKKNEVEKIQLANLDSPGSLASKKLNFKKTKSSVDEIFFRNISYFWTKLYNGWHMHFKLRNKMSPC